MNPQEDRLTEIAWNLATRQEKQMKQPVVLIVLRYLAAASRKEMETNYLGPSIDHLPKQIYPLLLTYLL